MSWQSAIELEHEVAKYHAQQVLNGVLFDVEAAHKLANEIENELGYVERRLSRELPLRTVQVGTTVSKPFKKDGSFTKAVLDWYTVVNEDGETVPSCHLVFDDLVIGPFSKVRFEKLNLKSHVQVKDWLLSIGWKPTEFTEKGSPKLTEDSFDSLPDGSLGKLLGRKNMLTHRLNMIRNPEKEKGFVHMIREDGRIEADAITLGAATGRYAHIGVANLPRVSTEYGKEIRSLFTVPEDKVMIGWDLAGIENRIAGHYLAAYDKGAFAKEVLEGDFHQTTADAFGISRDEAKTLRYMILYGAQPKKISASMGWSLSKARRVFKDFWKKEKHLDRMNQRLIQAAKRGWINGLDGRKLFPRSQHAMLNFLFQSAATIVFKRAMVLMNEKLISAGVEYKQLISYHDEICLEADSKDVEGITKIVKESVKEAGEYYNLRVPVDTDIQVGDSWAEVH